MSACRVNNLRKIARAVQKLGKIPTQKLERDFERTKTQRTSLFHHHNQQQQVISYGQEGTDLIAVFVVMKADDH
jgi:hypothetical protein